MIPTINSKLNIGSVISSVSEFVKSLSPGRPQASDGPASALLPPKLRYGRGFEGAVTGLPGRIPWGWLGMSALGMVMSTFMNFLGFMVVFPDKAVAAFLMALMLEGFVAGTGVMVQRANRAARPWLVAMVLLFAGTSVLLSVAGMNAGAEQFQQRLNLPRYEHEDAVNAEAVFAAAVSKTEDAALGRITNEISFITKHSAASDGSDSGFARDREQRKVDLNDLKAKWQALDFSHDFAGVKPTDQLWTILQHEWAIIQPLVAETNKLTSGQPIPTPGYPVAPDHAAQDAHSGANDVTGMNSLRHPSLRWVFIIPLALMMDIGPMLVAAGMRALDNGDDEGDDPDGPEPQNTGDAPLGLHDEWDERQRRMRRIGDDLHTDPMAVSCDSVILTQVEAYRSVECGALSNITLQRSLEVFEEEAAVFCDAASRVGIAPDTVRKYLDESFSRLQERLRQERLVQDGEHGFRIRRQLGEQELQGLANSLALARQIAGIQAELDALGGRR